MRMTLNQLLADMDGFSSSEGIVVIAATNFPEVLDKALTRPGRFDRHVVVPNPDVKGRTQVSSPAALLVCLRFWFACVGACPSRGATRWAEGVVGGILVAGRCRVGTR